eukprot:jgi/Bigna1/140737/aug1.58_g15445
MVSHGSSKDPEKLVHQCELCDFRWRWNVWTAMSAFRLPFAPCDKREIVVSPPSWKREAKLLRRKNIATSWTTCADPKSVLNMDTADAPKKLKLKCRRALKAFEKEKLPGLLEEINKAAGTEIKSVGADDLGKAAIKASLAELHFTLDEKTAPSSNFKNGLKLADSKLTTNFKPMSNLNQSSARAQAIQKLLEEQCNVAVESKEIFPLEQARPLTKFKKDLLPGFLAQMKTASESEMKIAIDEKAIASKGSKCDYDNT